MGKLKEAMLNQEETKWEPDPNGYLTMARICNAEWGKYEKKAVWGKGFIGFAELAIKNAFEAGFMAGFEGRYFKETGE